MKIIEQLRRGGYKVRVTHKRMYVTDEFHCQLVEMSKYERDHILINSQLPFIMLERGGTTIVDITTPDGRTSTASAVCSMKDNFNRKEGLRLAVKRALANLPPKIGQ